jgi:MoaA/NifB/PqqE/SkfB family radical SAM enzyme
VVIWNLIRRCNLTCKHCYTTSANIDFPGELSTEAIYKVIHDLKAFKVPVLILSGGEPLLHPDIFNISQRAKDIGFYVALSSNGLFPVTISLCCPVFSHCRHFSNSKSIASRVILKKASS